MVEVQGIKASEARRWLDEGRAELIDIRDPGERGQMRIPEARWIPLTGLEAGLKAEPHQKIGIFTAAAVAVRWFMRTSLQPSAIPRRMSWKGASWLGRRRVIRLLQIPGLRSKSCARFRLWRVAWFCWASFWEYGSMPGFSDFLLSLERASCFPAPPVPAEWP